jgi:hypothetical protein
MPSGGSVSDGAPFDSRYPPSIERNPRVARLGGCRLGGRHRAVGSKAMAARRTRTSRSKAGGPPAARTTTRAAVAGWGGPSESSDLVIRCTAELFRPAETSGGEGGAWMFLRLPIEASARLASRGMVSIRGTLQGIEFSTTLRPDGEGGHWMRVDETVWRAARVKAHDRVEVEFVSVPREEEPEPEVPTDLREALAGAANGVRAAWSSLTPAARRDFVFWITSPKRAETRAKRVATACDMLATGKRRPCCFDRSGKFDKSQSCPVAEARLAKQRPTD